jgi:hypothetical protein
LGAIYVAIYLYTYIIIYNKRFRTPSHEVLNPVVKS